MLSQKKKIKKNKEQLHQHVCQYGHLKSKVKEENNMLRYLNYTVQRLISGFCIRLKNIHLLELTTR